MELNHCPTCGHLMDAGLRQCASCQAAARALRAAAPHSRAQSLLSRSPVASAVLIGTVCGVLTMAGIGMALHGEPLRYLAASLHPGAWSSAKAARSAPLAAGFLLSLSVVIWIVLAPQARGNAGPVAEAVVSPEQIAAGAGAAIVTGALLALVALLFFSSGLTRGAGEAMDSRADQSLSGIWRFAYPPVCEAIAIVGAAMAAGRRSQS